ncbi:hypothetical protein CRG98_031388 [Punica granatum]|uniref:Uncharacterized protein n=1 Tax=Punica granatum TaxID=22663 RepID=A0A2I0IWU7_PUNGR|nr:hypothetical protein CRG98_031388 [Punica granatum]
MARRRSSGAPGGRFGDPIVFAVGMWGWRLQIENLCSEMDLGGGKYVGWFSVGFDRFWPRGGSDEMRKRAGV